MTIVKKVLNRRLAVVVVMSCASESSSLVVGQSSSLRLSVWSSRFLMSYCGEADMGGAWLEGTDSVDGRYAHRSIAEEAEGTCELFEFETMFK